MRGGIATGAQWLGKSGLQNEKLVVAGLFVEDVAQFLKACSSGEMRALLVDPCSRGAAFDAADREAADGGDQQGGGHHQDDDQREAVSAFACGRFFRTIHDGRSE